MSLHIINFKSDAAGTCISKLLSTVFCNNHTRFKFCDTMKFALTLILAALCIPLTQLLHSVSVISAFQQEKLIYCDVSVIFNIQVICNTHKNNDKVINKVKAVLFTKWSQINLLGYFGFSEQFFLCQTPDIRNMFAIGNLPHDGWTSFSLTCTVFGWPRLVTCWLAQRRPVCSVTSATCYQSNDWLASCPLVFVRKNVA